MNSPIPRTYIAGEIGSGELRVTLDIDKAIASVISGCFENSSIAGP
jgi:hypothetical protein